jgi:pimeloyl-ACP methyl ester carboxylesterase
VSLPVTTANFSSFDGTRIVYDQVGDGPLPVILANGFGGNTQAWGPLVESLLHRCRFYCPDHRGLFRSEVPADPDAYGIAHHAGDLEALMRDRGLSRAVFMGWSMGCKVSLELFRRHPNRVRAFVFLSGADQLPIRHLIPDEPHLFSGLRRLGERLAPLSGRLNRLAHRAVEHPRSVALALRLLGFIDKRLDVSVGAPVLRGFLRSDPAAIFKTGIEIANFSARAISSRVCIPALVVTGERDRVIPARSSINFAASLPHGSMVVVPRATHYALLEYPEVVSLHIEGFLTDIGALGPEGGAPLPRGPFSP